MKYPDKKEVRYAFELMQKMESDGLTAREARKSAEILLDLAKQNNARLIDEEPHKVRLELNDIILPHETAL